MAGPMPTEMTFEIWFAGQHPKIPLGSALAVLRLADGGATVPFIARYRKEATGNLDEVAIRDAIDAKATWEEILTRQKFIGEEIQRQGKLTPELKERLLATFDLTALEDLYLPYKQKRKTKAALAREAGLGPLADWLWDCGHGATPADGETPETRAQTLLRRRDGRGRHRGGAGGRGRDPHRAAGRGHGPAPARPDVLLRRRLRAHAQGQARQGGPNGRIEN